MPARPSNVDQLRHAIDSGKGGDKVAFTDPATAPLGTDDEAAGTPPRPERVEAALAAEVRKPGYSPRREARGMGPVLVVIAYCVGLAALLGLMLLARA